MCLSNFYPVNLLPFLHPSSFHPPLLKTSPKLEKGGSGGALQRKPTMLTQEQLEEVAGPEKQEELLGFGEVILGGAGARPRRQGQRIQHRCYGRDELSWSGSVLPKRAAPARKGEPAAQRPWAGEGHEGEDVDLEKCRWGLAPDPPSPWGHSHNTHLTPVLVIREGGRCAWGRLPDSSCEPPVSRYTPRTPVRRAELL